MPLRGRSKFHPQGCGFCWNVSFSTFQQKIFPLCPLRLERPTGAGERKRQLKIKIFISRSVAYAPSSPQSTQRKIENILVTRIVRKLNSGHTSCPFGAEEKFYTRQGMRVCWNVSFSTFQQKNIPPLCPLRLE